MNINQIATIIAFCLLSCAPKVKSINESQLKIIDESNVNLDLLSDGQYQYYIADYQLPPSIDHSIIPKPPSGKPETTTQINARLYLPKGDEQFPLVIFLHGESYTCAKPFGNIQHLIPSSFQFTKTGTCEPGAIELTSHLGFDYTAKHLASHGIASISVNTNRGITGGTSYYFSDDALIVARGRLILTHLKLLKEWNTFDNAPIANISLKNKFDFSRVGLVGHSRGGEGVRAAYNLYSNENHQNHWRTDLHGLKFIGIFEIGPIDRGIYNQSTSDYDYLNASNIPWTLLLPGCDGDVSTLEGTYVYQRMLNLSDNTKKSIFTMWGANHTFFNSQWQFPELDQCRGSQTPTWDTTPPLLTTKYPNIKILGNWPIRENVTGSPLQQKMAKGLIFAFFKAHIKNEKKFQEIFDPQYRLPHQLDQLATNSRDQFQNNLSFELYNGKNFANIIGNKITSMTLESWIDTQLKVYYKFLVLQNELPSFGSGVISEETKIFPATSLSWLPQGEAEIKINAFEINHFWTIDIAVATRFACDTNQDCSQLHKQVDFNISLEDSSGQTSKPVKLSEYIKLMTFQNKNFEILDRDDETTFFSYIPTPYSTVRIELKDFAWRQPPKKIEKIKLGTFSPESGHILINGIWAVKSEVN